MGEWAHFEEKEYETLANATFVLDAGVPANVQIFSPGQVLENRLGIDFANRVGAHSPLRNRLFGPLGAPSGIAPTQAAHHQLPANARLLNLFCQYKRPMRFTPGHRSPLWPTHQTFLRFEAVRKPANSPLDFTQIQALDALQAAFGTNAAVRYLCPAITDSGELYAAFAAGDIIQRSACVSVDALRDGQGYHRYWTFAPNDLANGIPNPGGPPAKASSAFEFLEDVRESSIGTRAPELFNGIMRKSIDAFQSSEASRPALGKPSRRNLREARLQHEQIHAEIATLGLDGDSSKEILDWVDVTQLIDSLNLSWTIAVLP